MCTTRGFSYCALYADFRSIRENDPFIKAEPHCAFDLNALHIASYTRGKHLRHRRRSSSVRRIFFLISTLQPVQYYIHPFLGYIRSHPTTSLSDRSPKITSIDFSGEEGRVEFLLSLCSCFSLNGREKHESMKARRRCVSGICVAAPASDD